MRHRAHSSALRYNSCYRDYHDNLQSMFVNLDDILPHSCVPASNMGMPPVNELSEVSKERLKQLTNLIYQELKLNYCSSTVMLAVTFYSRTTKAVMNFIKEFMNDPNFRGAARSVHLAELKVLGLERFLDLGLPVPRWVLLLLLLLRGRGRAGGQAVQHLPDVEFPHGRGGAPPHPGSRGRRYRALGALQSRTPSYFSRTRRREKTMGSVSTPVQPFKIEDPAPAAGPTRLIWTVIWMTVLLCPVTASVNPHQPVKITWTLWNGLTREVLNLTTGIHPPNTWWPDLYFNLKDLIKTTWTAAQTRNFGFWACPGHLKRHNWETCGGLQHYFCGPGAV
ncbi:uncharacterized protein [Ovis canadensis]|uniref:uncharacterized protein n=1 Tax=Ovis canadensis TaxID=37174 RepID=UPI003750530D